MEYPDELNLPCCHHCQTRDEQKNVEMRQDYYGLATGFYCDDCYENHYPYRKDAYYDPEYCGERMDEDY
jgi:hypothetical protein